MTTFASAMILLGLFAGGVLALALRTWIKTLVEKNISSRFEAELESVRSDLRLKESKITALQTNVLSGRAGRRALLDKRQIEAVERLWAATLKLDTFKISATMLSILKLGALDKQAQHDEKIREFLKTISGGSNIAEKLAEVGGDLERPFVPNHVWKIFEAYQSLLIYCYIRLQVAAIGIGDTEGMFEDGKVISSIKEIMPHAAEYLDKHGVTGAAHLVDPIRELLIEALRATLKSNDDDDQSLLEVVKMVEKLDRTLAQATE